MAWKHSLQDVGGKKKERASALPCHRFNKQIIEVHVMLSICTAVVTVGTFVRSHKYITPTPACALAEAHTLQTSIALQAFMQATAFKVSKCKCLNQEVTTFFMPTACDFMCDCGSQTKQTVLEFAFWRTRK